MVNPVCLAASDPVCIAGGFLKNTFFEELAKNGCVFEDFEAAVPAEHVIAGSGIGGSRCYRYVATAGQRKPAGPMLLARCGMIWL